MMRWHNKAIIDKSAIGEPKASGIWSPGGTSEHRQGWSREATEPLLTIKNNLNPERSERVAASHGVGRKPGDGRRLLHIEAEASAAHSFRRGSIIFCLLAGAAPAKRAYPCLLSYVPSGLKFRSADASQAVRQTRVCRYCLMMPMRVLCPLIMLVGSGAYVYHQIGNSPRKSAANEG